MLLEVVIMAAGQGSRMHSNHPKVLHSIGGKPMLMHVIETAMSLSPEKIHIITGYGAEKVQQVVNQKLTNGGELISWCLQKEQNGTGHAVMQAMPDINMGSDCLVLNGDVPLVDSETLTRVCNSKACLVLCTAIPEDNNGLGRILRDEKGQAIGIVEQKDASKEQLAIAEIYTGILKCRAKSLAGWLDNLSSDNSQGEYYLTDIVANAVLDGESIDTVIAEQSDLLLGINSRAQLARTERIYQRKQAQRLMDEGVSLADPTRIDVRGDIDIGRDCWIDINVVLQGQVRIGHDVTIEPNCIIKDATIGDHCVIKANSIIDQAEVGDYCQLGPFARLRPGTHLANNVHIGNFVEIKKSNIGEHSKANHLAYVGDTTVGKDVNIGAGVITCNYDGANKHQTIIGDNVFVGSDSQLVAPITIADGATIGAGTTLTRNVEENALAISRAPQKSLTDWKRPKKQ